MTFAFATVRTRRAKPLHEQWIPHAYQRRATEFLLENGAAALFADPGLGKTSIVLNAVSALKEEGVVDKVLVIAPKRVCELVWWQEANKWAQFRHLTFAWLHSSRAPWAMHESPKKKEAELQRDADIYLINPEGIKWLRDQFYPHPLPFDTVVVDELTRFKNARAQRSKLLRKMTMKTPRVWGLTGTPAPNGYNDLFGQMLLLDGGNALGQYYTRFRDKYFTPSGFGGFQYKILPGAEKLIEKRIKPLTLRMSAEDYLDLPPLVDDVRIIKLDPKSRKTYEKMKRDMLLSFDDGTVTAANAAALYSKLSQMANGAVYVDEDPLQAQKRGVVPIHDAKLDALEELIDELSGQPVLIGYEFNHDLKRLLERFGKDSPYLGSGVTGKRAQEIESAWNRGEIPFLFAHPASTGHGLNLQQGNAAHVCWFSASWDFELYDQFVRRVYRQGNQSEHVVNHILCVEDTIDVQKIEALRDKDMTQGRLLDALNSEILHDAGSPAAGNSAAPKKEADMAGKLSRKSDGAATRKFTPKGWGKPADEPESSANDDDEEGSDEEEQRSSIRSKLSGKSRKVAEPEDDGENGDDGEDDGPPQSAFSSAVRKKMAGEDDDGDDAGEEEPTPKPKPKTKRSAPKTKKAATVSITPEQVEAIAAAAAAATAAAVTAAIEKILDAD